MLQIIKEYQAIKKNIPSIIEVSGYRNDYIAKKIGLSTANFAVKKQRGTWSDADLQKILELVSMPNDDVENYIMLEIMRGRKDDENVSYEDYKKEVASWT